MFYMNDNKFVCGHVLTKIVYKYLHITHHYRFSIGDFNCPCGIAKYIFEKGANFKCCNWGIDQ